MDEIQTLINNETALMIYFSHEGCNVCKVLKPKLKQLLNDKFPKIKFLKIDTIESPEISAQKSVFAVPTILVYFKGLSFFDFPVTSILMNYPKHWKDHTVCCLVDN